MASSAWSNPSPVSSKTTKKLEKSASKAVASRRSVTAFALIDVPSSATASNRRKLALILDPLLVFLVFPTLCRVLALSLIYAAAGLCNANLAPTQSYSCGFNALGLFAYVNCEASGPLTVRSFDASHSVQRDRASPAAGRMRRSSGQLPAREP